MTPQLKNKTKLKTIRLIWNIKHRRVHMHFLFFLHVHYNVHVQPWYYKESPVATTPATQAFVMARNIARNIACKKISECNQLVIQIFFTSNTLILTAPIMWSRHWLIDTPLPPLLVCIVTGTTLPRTDRWLCQKRARLDDVPELILVVGPLGTTNSKGVPGSFRFKTKKW